MVLLYFELGEYRLDKAPTIGLIHKVFKFAYGDQLSNYAIIKFDYAIPFGKGSECLCISSLSD